MNLRLVVEFMSVFDTLQEYGFYHTHIYITVAGVSASSFLRGTAVALIDSTEVGRSRLDNILDTVETVPFPSVTAIVPWAGSGHARVTGLTDAPVGRASEGLSSVVFKLIYRII